MDGETRVHFGEKNVFDQLFQWNAIDKMNSR